MRTTSLSIEGLLINRLPSIFIVIATLVIIAGALIFKYTKTKHKKGIQDFTKSCLIPIVFGIFLIGICYFVSLDTLKYTHGTEETIATIIDKETNRSYHRKHRRKVSYTYTIKYIDNEVEKKAYLHTTLGNGFEVGDKISVYYVPDENEDSYNHTVVAVDFEKAYWDRYITAGMISSVLGLLLVLFLKIKEDSVNNGVPTSAKVIQILPVQSKLSKNKTNYQLICQGRNPVTQMITTFTTTGRSSDFIAVDEGSTITVVISKENPKSYIISI